MDVDDTRSVRQIEEDIEATRDQLASTIDELVYRAKPATIVQRQKEQSLAALREATRYPDGALRYDRIAMAAAVALTLVALGIYRRRRA